MIDMSMKSPANSWMINDSLQRIGAQASKKSVSSERKNPGQGLAVPLANTNSSSDFNKIFKPQMKSLNAKTTKHIKHASAAAASTIAAVHLYGTPSGGVLGTDIGSSDYANHLKGIGKMQPFNDFKLNEQTIRGKLGNNRNNSNAYMKNMNSGAMLDSMQKSDYLAPPDQQVMINVTRGSNLQLIPLTEVLSPKNMANPLNNYSAGGDHQGPY